MTTEPAEGTLGVSCPDCGAEFTGPTGPMRLGSHRRRAHGIVGKGSHRKKRAASSRRPRTAEPAAADPPRIDLAAELRAWADSWEGARPRWVDALDRRADKIAEATSDLVAETEVGARVVAIAGAGGIKERLLELAVAVGPVAGAAFSEYVAPNLTRYLSGLFVRRQPLQQPDGSPLIGPDGGQVLVDRKGRLWSEGGDHLGHIDDLRAPPPPPPSEAAPAPPSPTADASGDPAPPGPEEGEGGTVWAADGRPPGALSQF